MGPLEVVVHVRQVLRVRAKEVIQLRVTVVLLKARRLVSGRGALGRGVDIRQGGIGVIPRGEQVVEWLKVHRVVAHAGVVGIPRLVEVLRGQTLHVPQPATTTEGGRGEEILQCWCLARQKQNKR